MVMRRPGASTEGLTGEMNGLLVTSTGGVGRRTTDGAAVLIVTGVAVADANVKVSAGECSCSSISL